MVNGRVVQRWLVGMLSSLVLLLAAPGARAQDLLLAISEGTSGGTDHARVIAKYGPLAELLGRAARQKVVVVFAREFAQLDEGMKSGRFDFVMARPSDYPARALRDHGFRYVAHAKPDGQCLIIVQKDSPLKTLADARGKRWVLPEPAAYMTKFCSAELRDRGIDLGREKVQHVREQSSIPTYLTGGFGDVGGVASYSSVGRGLDAAGMRVLHASRPQPYFPLVAGKRIGAAQIEAVRKELIALGASAGGRELLKSIGIDAFVTDGAADLDGLLAWLEQGAKR